MENYSKILSVYNNLVHILLMEDVKLDDKDFAIIDILSRNAKQSIFQLAKKLNIPPTTIHNRIKKLRANGVIRNYVVQLDREKMGQKVCALVFVSLDNNLLESKSKKGGLARELIKYPNVDEIFETSGTVDIIVKVYGTNIKDITEFVINTIREVKGVIKTETVFALSEIHH
ncbi:putative HTH-type transcriptional regulator [Candidatus Bilamarchaeum dharawalense]|uniref:Putative HTH-type transcriptional regulator n=1 Tax=Candidatus Bilamarchaeum dharawalense TaxID=2885759 RepID=A0A5E4LN19_9ARCH|nr:putative HTH-type transcriptional regulator [Candidatus Bilamarchaeum dharawalense]